MSLVEMICKKLGVEVGEKWEGNDGYKYRISKNGEIFSYDKRGIYTGSRGFGKWESVFNGELKPTWKPKEGERIFSPTIGRLERNRYITFIWLNQEWENWYYDMGLIYRTKEEAIAAATTMIVEHKEQHKSN